VAAGVTSVGARLILSGRSAFVASADAATDAMKAFRDVTLEAADAAKTLSGSVDASTADIMAATRASSAVTTEAATANTVAVEKQIDIQKAWAAANAESVLGHQKQADAVDKLTVSTTKYEGALAGLASNTLIKKLSLYGDVGVAGAAYEGLKQYMSLSQQMTQVTAQAGVAAKNLPTLTQGVMGISRETGESFAAVAEQLYRIASARAGLHSTNQELLRLTQMSAQLNVLGNVTGDSSQELTARVIGALMNAQLVGAKNPQQIAALANAAVGAGDIRMSQLIASIGRGAIPAAKLVGVSAPQTLAWIDLLTKLGNNPSTAGTLIAHNLISLGGATEQAQKVMEMIGLSPSAIQDVMKTPANKGGGLAGAVKDLLGHMKQFNPVSYYPATGGNAAGYSSAMYQLQAYGILTPSQIQQWTQGNLSPSAQSDLETKLIAKMFGAAKQSVPIATLVKYLPQFTQTLNQINAQANQSQYAKDVGLAENTPQNTMLRVRRSLDTMSYSIGQEVYPTLKKMAEYGGDVALWLGKNPEVTVWLVRIGAAILTFTTGVIAINKISKVWNAFLNLFGKGVLTGQSANTASLDTNTAALTRLTEVMGGEGVEGGGRGGVLGAGGGFFSTGVSAGGLLGAAIPAAIITDLLGHGLQAIFAKGSYGNNLGYAMTFTGMLHDLDIIAHNTTQTNNYHRIQASATHLQGYGTTAIRVIPAHVVNGKLIGPTDIYGPTPGSPAWNYAHGNVGGLLQYLNREYQIAKANPGKNNTTGIIAQNQINLTTDAIRKLGGELAGSSFGKTKSGKSAAEVLEHLDNTQQDLFDLLEYLKNNGLTAVVSGTQVTKVIQSVQAAQVARTSGSYATSSSSAAPTI
jgi:hypothetical protein